jgi:tetratricopeptide (TPR) repeat protein
VALYRALLSIEAPRELVAAHLLEFLAWALEDIPVPRHVRTALWQLIQPETALELKPELDPGWLRRLVAAISLPTNLGNYIHVLELRKSRKPLYYGLPGELVGDDLPVLLLTELQARRVEALLRPARSLRKALPWTGALGEVVQAARGEGPISTLEMLRGMLAVPGSAAGKVLRELVAPEQLAEKLRQAATQPARSKLYTGEMRSVWKRARQEASARRALSSEALLLAMLQTDCAAGQLLREFHVDLTLLGLEVASVIGLECPADRRLEPQSRDGELQQIAQKAYFMLDTGRFEQAEGQLKRAAELAPEDARVRGMAAFSMFLAGQPEMALQMFERALSLGPDPECEAWILSRIGEVQLSLGQERDAWVSCEDALRLDAYQPHANALKARLLTDPLKAVQQCQRALKLTGCPASAWETQGLRLLELDLPEDARQCLATFLELAAKERLMEPDVDKRIEHVRELLRKLS